MRTKVSMAVAVGIMLSANFVVGAPVFAKSNGGGQGVSRVTAGSTAPSSQGHGRSSQGSGLGKGKATGTVTDTATATTSAHGKSVAKAGGGKASKSHAANGGANGHSAKAGHASHGQAGAQVQGVVQKVYGAIAKLNAYESITVRTTNALTSSSIKGKKVKRHAEQVAKQDLRSVHQFLVSAVHQLGVAESVYGEGDLAGLTDSGGTSSDSTATSTDSSTTTVTDATYGTSTDVVATLKAVATALQADVAAVSALSNGVGSGGGSGNTSDVSAIVADLRSQVATLRSLKSSLPSGTAPSATGRKK